MERRKKTNEKQARLEKLWAEYDAEEKSMEEFLEEVSIYAAAWSFLF